MTSELINIEKINRDEIEDVKMLVEYSVRVLKISVTLTIMGTLLAIADTGMTFLFVLLAAWNFYDAWKEFTIFKQLKFRLNQLTRRDLDN